MRIAQVAPLYEAVPPRLYGGTERVVAQLCDELVRQGHDVTLFGAGESETLAKLEPCREKALRLDGGLTCDVAAHLLMLERVRERAREFDIIHFHTDCLHMPLFRDMAGRTVTTLHGRLDLWDLKPFYAHFSEYPLVSISDAQRAPLESANWIGTVYHGYDPAQYVFKEQPEEGYLAFLGRISPEKRPDRAIEIAKRAGVPLKIAAKVDKADAAYFAEVIQPLLDHPLIEFVGEIGDDRKSDFLGNASALLFPIDWPEPFGLVMIEAMACGTPVIAFPHGSVPEVVDEGVTGFIVDDLDQAVEAVAWAGVLDRVRVRQTFEARFSSATMAREYLRLYEALVRSAHLRHRAPAASARHRAANQAPAWQVAASRGNGREMVQ